MSERQRDNIVDGEMMAMLFRAVWYGATILSDDRDDFAVWLSNTSTDELFDAIQEYWCEIPRPAALKGEGETGE